MSQIVDDLRQVAIEIKTETQVGGNTAARVGGAFERVADALEGTQQIEDMDAAVAAVQQAAQENEQTIQNIVNGLAVVQTTGQSTSNVMSQKAVTDEINNLSDNLSENLRDVEDSVFTLTTEDIPLTMISGKYYTYNEGIQRLDNTNFSCASPVDISKYIKVSLNFYVAPKIESGTYFTDENGEMVGVKMTNTTGTYKDFDVPEGAKWLYLTTRTKSQAAYGARGTEKTSIKDDVAEIEEKTIIPKELSITSYPERRYVIAISTGKWTASYQTDKRHILVPVGDFVKFRITGGGDKYSCYSFLKSNAAAVASGTPDYATGYTGVKFISKGVTKDVDIPEDALYLYISLRNIDSNGSAHYEPQALYGLNDIDDVVMDNRSRIEALEEEQVTLPYEYFGSKINFNKKFHYNITSWMSMSVAHQSGASFGNYYFMLTNLMANVYVYNLASKTRIFTWTNPETLSSIHHCNQCDFSTLYYDANDPFPILYVSVKEQTSGQYNGRCSIEAYRITATMQDDEYTSFDFVKVQTIYLPLPTEENSMNDADVAIDRDRKRMVIYSKVSVNGYWLATKITEFNIPSTANEIVDLTDAQRLIHYNINADSRAAQGGVIHNCKLYYGRGYANAGHIELDAIDLISKCLLADIDLYGNGFTAEPEGAFIYNDELYISTNNNAIFKVEFE